jgi:hypothetical protein
MRSIQPRPPPGGQPISEVPGEPIAEMATSQDAPGATISLRGSLYYPPVDGARSDDPDRGRQTRGSRALSFVSRGTDLTQRRMTTPLVIEHFDVVEQLHLGFAAVVEVLSELELHGGEETLHHRVVIAVAAPAHAAGDAVGREPPLSRALYSSCSAPHALSRAGVQVACRCIRLVVVENWSLRRVTFQLQLISQVDR